MMKELVRKLGKVAQSIKWNGLFSVLLIAALLIASVPLAQAKGPPPDARAHPLLFEIAEEMPDSRIRVIVQIQRGQSGAKQEARKHGGVVLKDLPMINAFVLELPARAVEALALAPGVRWVSLDAPVVSTAVSTETVRDEFNAASYSGNDGTVTWEGDWVEYDVAGRGPTFGNIQIVSGELSLDDCPDSYTQPSISREVNLSDAVTAATFTFDFRTGPGVDDSDRIAIDVSSDGGANYTVLEVIGGISGAASGSMTYDITAYISADTMIRFRVFDRYGGPDEYFAVDNVQIEYTSGINSTPTPAPPSDDLLPENYYLDTLGVQQVWDMGLQGEGITVAVVDSGITRHYDLAATADLTVDEPVSRIQKSANFTNSSGDHYGHGTHIAGTIGGNGASSGGAYMGMAPLVNLLDVKISDNQGMAFTSAVVDGLQWIYENRDVYNIRVVNLSLNSTVPEPYHVSPLDAAVEILWFNGIVVVVSAGNNGDDPDAGTVYPPANDPFVITVGATDEMGTVDRIDDVLAAFSAYGTTEEGFAKPDLVAPGRSIVSLLSSLDCEIYMSHPAHRVNEYYFRMSGTSMAAAVTTGAVVLLLQDEPHLTPDQVKYRLMATALPFDTPERTGAGYLDIYAAVHGTTTESANIGIAESKLLWAGEDPIVWDSVNWTSVNWNSVNWNSVNWTSVNWNSVNWNSSHWDD